MTNEKALVAKLTERLGQLKVDDGVLKQVLDAAKLLGSKGTVTRVFPKGIVWPDGLSLEAELSAEHLAVVSELLKDVGGIRGVEVFPIGIVVPDKFRALINLG